MWFRMAFLFVVLIVFAASVRSVAQSSSSPSLLAVCEGDGCSLWEFNGGHATGTFPDGVVANLRARLQCVDTQRQNRRHSWPRKSYRRALR